MSVRSTSASDATACVEMLLAWIPPDESDLVLGPLGGTADLPVEHGGMVRQPSVYRGQRHFPGWYHSATCGRHVIYESWLERSHFILLDQDPQVTAFASQPFQLHWRDEDGRARTHVPDIFVRHTDGSASVIDVRPERRINPEDRLRFEATRTACDHNGWGYRVAHEPPVVLLRNVTWLAGYRRRLPTFATTRSRVLDAADTPCTIADLVNRCGGTPTVRATVFHLLWTGSLVTDLDHTVLSDDSVVIAV